MSLVNEVRIYETILQSLNRSFTAFKMTMVFVGRALPLDPDEIKIRFHPYEILNSNFMGQVGQAHLLFCLDAKK